MYAALRNQRLRGCLMAIAATNADERCTHSHSTLAVHLCSMQKVIDLKQIANNTETHMQSNKAGTDCRHNLPAKLCYTLQMRHPVSIELLGSSGHLTMSVAANQHGDVA